MDDGVKFVRTVSSGSECFKCSCKATQCAVLGVTSRPCCDSIDCMSFAATAVQSPDVSFPFDFRTPPDLGVFNPQELVGMVVEPEAD